MSVTARATIEGTLKLINVLDPVETMQAEDAEDGLSILNDMVDQWALENLNLFSSTLVSASFSGASATIGPSGTFNTARPIRLNHAYWRQGTIDTPLEIIRDRALYDGIPEKTQGGEPRAMFYDDASPLGTVYVWPVPSTTQYFLNVDAQLSQFADLDTSYDLPQGYRMALKVLLAEQMAPLYQKPLSADVRRLIQQSRRILKRANAVVPQMQVDYPQHRRITTSRLADFLGG